MDENLNGKQKGVDGKESTNSKSAKTCSSKSNQKKLNDKFIIYTTCLSFLLCLLFIWKAYAQKYISIDGYIFIALNFLYIPFVLIFGKKIFSIYYFIYASVLIFFSLNNNLMFYNNYTGLFFVSIVVMLSPKLRWPALIIYFTVFSISFVCSGSIIIYHYLIHITRSFWFIGIIEYVLNDRFRRKKLVLYEDERQILEQLSGGMVYQKEVIGFSENTVYRKLKAARERNGNLTREQLVKIYMEEKENSQN